MKRGCSVCLILVFVAVLARGAVGPLSGGEVALAVPPAWSLEGTPWSDDPGDRLVTRCIHAGLVRLDARGEVSPDLARGWEKGSQPGSWILYLDEAASFHDGRPVTAQDVVDSLDALGRRTGSTLRWIGSALNVEAGEGSVTLRGSLGEDTLRLLAHPAAAILPEGRWNPNRPVGAGPFRRLGRGSGRVRLRPFGRHHRGRPLLDGVVVGHLNSLERPPEVLVAEPWSVAGLPADFVEIRRSGVGTLVLLLSERARRQLEPARLLELLDREAVAQGILRGGAESARGLLPPAASPHLPIWDVAPPLLPQRSGREAPGALGVSFPPSHGAAARVVGRLELALQELGARPTSDPPADLTLLDWYPADLDPEIALEELSGRVEWREGSGIARERSLVERRGVLPLVHLDRTVAHSPDLIGMWVDPTGIPVLEDAWLGTDGERNDP